ncbi:MAG: thiamine phosphate synthase [Gammaproteobacteria bacterium]|nr:thiamine phosphate synthase [Gammaproteobacteria bacterium]
MARPPLDGIYLVTDTALCAKRGIEPTVHAALKGGVRVVQYRDKTNDEARRRKEAAALARICQEHGATFLVNDDIALAAESGADGVHVGKDDAALETARERLGPGAIIGVSCYNEFSRAEAAARAGADYIAFGSVFPSPTKPDAPRAPLALFEQARAQLDIPVCAIGGIDQRNIQQVAASGAHLFAVITALLDADDITAAAARLNERIALARG